MKALSVRQPWTWLIIQGNKRIENRTWRTDHRGLLAIHASSHRREYDSHYPGGTDGMPALPELGPEHFGHLVGLVDLVDCVPFAEVEGRPFAEGPWCWLLKESRLIVPVPWRGMPGLFSVPDDQIVIRPS
jgi:hypothetical protein